MNFIDRTSLGDTLAQRLQQFRGKDAVVVCLQEGAILTCLTVASQIRAWIYPLMYEPVYTTDQARTLLGAYDQDGEFCPLPSGPAAGSEKSEEKSEEKESEDDQEIEKMIKKQKTAAMKAIRTRITDYGLEIDKRQLEGRDVILVGDVITNPLPLAVVQRLLQDVRPKSIAAGIGNVTPEVAQQVRIIANPADILDILTGIYYDEDRYFERADTYTAEQKHTLTQHIATYWQ